MKRAFILILVLTILSGTDVSSQTRRRTPAKRRPPVSKAAEKQTAEIKAGRERVAVQIKNLTLFLYLFGGIAKGIESADQATRTREASSVAMEQNERNKARVKESLRNVREGLDKLETDFRINPALKSYHRYLTGVADLGEMAESQAAANRFDDAGRSLLRAVNQLADALAAMR
ncbi:MAG TPA: hypothetical protein VFQ92_04360 [Blastocatellia bacterium]|nr:hypothetical protein [Blastocatellia bacterium]